MKKKWDWGNPVDFGAVGLGDVDFFLCELSQGHPGAWMAVNVDDVDAYYAIIKERGAIILAEPEDKEWFMREMLVADPDENIMRFGHRIECD